MMRVMRPTDIGMGYLHIWCYKGRKNGAMVIIVQPLWHKSTLEVLQHQFHGKEHYEKALFRLRRKGQSLLK
jgi:hypothetical protein